MKNKFKLMTFGAVAGFCNGLFGSGGGTVVVPMLRKSGIENKKCHATSIAIIFPLSFVTAFILKNKVEVGLTDAFKYLPLGIIGALLGSFFLKKIPNALLKRIFGGIIVFSAVRLLLR